MDVRFCQFCHHASKALSQNSCSLIVTFPNFWLSRIYGYPCSIEAPLAGRTGGHQERFWAMVLHMVPLLGAVYALLLYPISRTEGDHSTMGLSVSVSLN